MSDEKDKKIIALEEEVKVLRGELDKRKGDYESSTSSYKWALTLSQEEIDTVVSNKIAKEMLDTFSTYDMTELKMVTDVIHFVVDKNDVEYFTDDFKHVLNLGLRTEQNLHKSIKTFLELTDETNLLQDYY